MENNYHEITLKFQEEAKTAISALAYNTWISILNLHSLEGDTAVFTVPTPFYLDQIHFYTEFVRNCLKEVIKVEYPNIKYIVEEDEKKETDIVNNASENVKSNLNTSLTFENFVIGENNRFAQAAAYAVSEAPGTAYNPLFIYGGVGLGKSHLAHSIGNEVLRRSPMKKILYVTSEQFTNDFINGIKDKSNENFRQKYRNLDVLIIDDIQFIRGKEGIQEEFFNTFNTIRDNGGQIVLTSDRPPKEINPLAERLRSRFLEGLLVDISNADYETRLAILRQRVQIEHLVIDDIILSNIATKIDTNIRELIGTLKKITAQASLTHSPITFELAEKAITDAIANKEKVISSDYIKDTVSKYFNIDSKDMDSSKRSNDIAYPRQIAMYLCRELAKMQYKSIGNAFGNRDHSTVMHACNKIEQEIKSDKNSSMLVDSVKNIILKPKEA